VIRMPMDDIISFLKSKDITRLAMHLKGDSLNEADIKLPCAYFIGNEGKGLTDKTSSECDKLIRIDMQGKAESLNAAASSAIIGYVLSTIRHNT
nr:23S rRNA (guanosine(2251)-2'-O)-methyltransferase RlmB [Saccharofermentans sp.]